MANICMVYVEFKWPYLSLYAGKIIREIEIDNLILHTQILTNTAHWNVHKRNCRISSWKSL